MTAQKNIAVEIQYKYLLQSSRFWVHPEAKL